MMNSKFIPLTRNLRDFAIVDYLNVSAEYQMYLAFAMLL